MSGQSGYIELNQTECILIGDSVTKPFPDKNMTNFTKIICNAGAEGVSVIFFSALIFCFDIFLYQNQMRNLVQKKILQGTPQQLD